MADNLKVAGLRLVIEGASQFNTTIGQINSQLKISSAEFDKLQAQYGKNSNSVEVLSGKQKLLQDKLRASKDIGEQYNRILDETIAKYGEDSAEADKVRAAIAKNEAEQAKLEQQLEAVTKQLNIQSSAWTQLGQKLEATGQKMQAIGDKMARIGKSLTTTVTAPLVGLGTAAVKTTADFDAEMSKVSAIAGATGDDFEALRAKAREMGAETKFSASEAAQAMEYMAMAGWKTEDMLDGISGIMSLAAASGEDLAMVSDIVTDGLTAFGMSAEDAGRFADVLAAASSNANTNVSMLGESFKYVAPLAGSMGYSIEDTALALGLMANSGVKASQAGTALRTMLTNMANPTAKMQAAMDNLGVSLTTSDGEMASLYDILLQLRSGFGELKISTEEYDERLKELNDAYEECRISEDEHEDGLMALAEAAFGAEGAMKAQNAAMLAGKQGLSGLMAIVNASDEDFDKLTNAIYGAEGSAEAMAAIMQDNLKGQLQILKSQLQELAISFGDILTPKIRAITTKIQEFVDKLNKMDDKQREHILTLAAVVAAIGPVLLVVGKLTSGIGKVITVVGKAATAIGALGGTVGSFGSILSALGGPIGIAVGALALLALACADGESEYSKLVKTLKDAEKSWRNVTEAKEEAYSKGAEEISDIQTLKLELDSLVDANGRVKEGYEERAAYIASELSEATGIEIKLVDGVIESYDELSAAIDNYVAKRRAEIALEAGADAYKVALQGRKDLEQAYVDSYNAMLKAQDDYNIATNGRDQAEAAMRLANATDLYEGIKTQYEGYGEEIKTYEADLAAFRNGEYDNVASGLSGLLVSMEQFTNMSRDEQEKQLADTRAAAEEKLALYQLTGDESTRIQADALDLQARQEASYLSTRNSSRVSSDSELERQQAASNARMSKEDLRANNELTAQDKTGQTEREGAQTSFNSRTEASQKTHSNAMVQNIRDSRGPALSATTDVTNAVGGQLEAVEGKAQGWGANAIRGFIAGIRSMISQVQAAAAETAGALELYIGHNSPAKKGPGRFIVKWGANAIKGWMEGMLSMRSKLEEAAASMSATAMSGLSATTNTDNRSYSFGGVNVQTMVVRNDTDIKQIAQELYRLQVANARSKGVLV